MGVGQQLLAQHLGADVAPATGGVLDLRDRDGHGVEGLQRRPQLVEVPVLGEAAGRGGRDVAVDDVADEVADLLVQVLALEHAAAVGVDGLALAVEDVVVLQDVLADLDVAGLDLGLRALDGARDHLGLDRDVVRHLGRGHEPVDHRRVEQAHQVVLQREVEAALAGVALAAGASAQLVVDAAGLVPLGAEDVEPAELGDLVVLAGHGLLGGLEGGRPRGLVVLRRLLRVEALLLERGDGGELGVAAEHDVGAAAGHVGRDGDGALAAGLGDDRGLALVVLGVEDLVRDAASAQLVGEVLALLDADRADQDRLAGGVALGDVLDDRVELGLLVLVDEVGLVVADHRPVGRDGDDAELVGRLHSAASVSAVPVMPESLS